MKKALHVLAASVAFLCILGFWLASAVAELWLDAAAVVTVKTAILQAMWLLIPSLMATAGSGFALARQRGGRLVEEKKRRMPLIALNGLLILLPAAILLRHKAAAGEFDAVFFFLQFVEMAAGALNLWWLARNFHAGLRLSGRLRQEAAR